MNDHLMTALADLDETTVLQLVQRRLDSGDNPLRILASCREGMSEVGKRYEAGDYFISDLIMASEIFKQATAILSSCFGAGSNTRGKVVMGTVKGDVHNIGKDIVVNLLRAANFDVHDLGVDVQPQAFVEAIKETGATVVGLSGLITISFESMKDTVALLQASGLRPQVRVMIGGGPVTENVQRYTGADAWGADAQMAVTLCQRWIPDQACE